jgi:aquaporin Z
MSMKKAIAEVIGTFWLVFAGCGSALLWAHGEPGHILAVALSFGLTVVGMAYAVGHISGCHLNPAVSVGLWAGGRLPARELPLYIVAQVVGGVLAGLLLMILIKAQAGGKAWDLMMSLEGKDALGRFATNAYGEPFYPLGAAFLMEAVMTFIFLFVILGATAKKAAPGFAGLIIGLTLTLIHLVSIPATNTSVNPARSTGVALFVRGDALGQLWLFWIAPIVGAAVAGALWRYLDPPAEA